MFCNVLKISNIRFNICNISIYKVIKIFRFLRQKTLIKKILPRFATQQDI